MKKAHTHVREKKGRNFFHVTKKKRRNKKNKPRKEDRSILGTCE